MKKKNTLWVIILIVLVILVIAGFFLYPKIEKAVIESQIEKANYCDVYSDCVDAGGKCPFGCWVYVNKNEVSKISELINSFDSRCVYGCLSCPTASCENNKCKPVCE